MLRDRTDLSAAGAVRPASRRSSPACASAGSSAAGWPCGSPSTSCSTARSPSTPRASRSFWLDHSALAVSGLLVCGLGVALYYPLGLARAIAASDGRPDLASARVGLGAALASGGGPFVLGALADDVGIHGALLVVPALLVIAAVGIRLGPSRQPAAGLSLSRQRPQRRRRCSTTATPDQQ